jgi:hypothetical protein
MQRPQVKVGCSFVVEIGFTRFVSATVSRDAAWQTDFRSFTLFRSSRISIMKMTRVLSFAFLLAMVPGFANAHFPWLIRGDDGKVALFFGEGLTDRTYKLPPTILKAEIYQQNGSDRVPVKVAPVESDSFVGLQSDSVVSDAALLSTQVTFGIHRGSRLDYYALHYPGKLPTTKSSTAAGESTLTLNAELVDTDGGIEVFITWKGKPLADAEVYLYCSEGHEEGTATTDANGKVTFTDQQVESGLNAIRVGHNFKEAGKLAETTYETQSHYLTMTFTAPEVSQ